MVLYKELNIMSEEIHLTWRITEESDRAGSRDEHDNKVSEA